VSQPRIGFGIIVLNGEPFTRYCLRALYPFAHEIIVAEGAVQGAAPLATADGHSTDGTLETLQRFKAEEDPDDKVQIVTRDGFWPEKLEQSRAFAQRATGDYLWQVDIDEFYHPHDLQRVIEMLRDDPSITAVSFRQITFFGDLPYVADGWYLRRGGAGVIPRVFKWGPGYRYIAHRPPTVADPSGVDCRKLRCTRGRTLARRGIRMHHYSLLMPRQVLDKSTYYTTQPWGAYSRGALAWAEENYQGPIQFPFRAHNVHIHPSWLERFEGSHPPAVTEMMDDIRSGRVQADLRDNSDVERVLASKRYRALRWVLKALCDCPVAPGRVYRWMMRLRFDHQAQSLRWR